MSQPPSAPTDEELLARIAKYDKEAFEQLVRKYRGKFTGIAKANGLSLADAEEAANDGLLQVWRCAAQSLESALPAQYWLRGVMKRSAVNKYRSIKTRLAKEVFSTLGDKEDEFMTDLSEQRTEDIWLDLSAPEATRLAHEHQRCVDTCLPKLSSTHRETLVLLLYAGQTLGEVAHSTRESLGTVKSRQHYALAKMRQCVEKILRSKEGESK